MRTMIRRSSYIVYLSIFVYNIVRINCEIWNDNEPDTMSDILETLLLLQRQTTPIVPENGSGVTGELSSEMPETSIQTSKKLSLIFT